MKWLSSHRIRPGIEYDRQDTEGQTQVIRHACMRRQYIGLDGSSVFGIFWRGQFLPDQGIDYGPDTFFETRKRECTAFLQRWQNRLKQRS